VVTNFVCSAEYNIEMDDKQLH